VRIVVNLPFEEVKAAQGAWLSVMQLEAITRLDWLRQEIRPDKVRAIRDELIYTEAVEQAGKPATFNNYLSLLCDLVVFEHIFIDEIAAARMGLTPATIGNTLGPLASIVRFVRPTNEVYETAMAAALTMLRRIPEGDRGKYLEERFGIQGNASAFWDDYLKAIFDELFRKNWPGNFPSWFADTDATIERMLTYFEIQRMSGAPVRLSSARVQLLSALGPIVQASVRGMMQQTNPQKTTEDHVAEQFGVTKDDIDTPSVFDLLMRELASGTAPRSVLDVVAEVRGWTTTAKYRGWLWSYHRALATQDFANRAKLLGQLGSHLDAIRETGKPRSQFTRRLHFSVATPYVGIIDVPVTLPFLRTVDEDYVGFIGEWLAPWPESTLP
jgi:hypothetical protein